MAPHLKSQIETGSASYHELFITGILGHQYRYTTQWLQAIENFKQIPGCESEIAKFQSTFWTAKSPMASGMLNLPYIKYHLDPTFGILCKNYFENIIPGALGEYHNKEPNLTNRKNYIILLDIMNTVSLEQYKKILRYLENNPNATTQEKQHNMEIITHDPRRSALDQVFLSDLFHTWIEGKNPILRIFRQASNAHGKRVTYDNNHGHLPIL
ncbi:MAG: hypothetical protein NZL83_03150 [Candidatus Absconditabacterales bacterium]|nr:hypothetical protein [Candidatus Absconditabacterales bacterium]